MREGYQLQRCVGARPIEYSYDSPDGLLYSSRDLSPAPRGAFLHDLAIMKFTTLNHSSLFVKRRMAHQHQHEL